MTKARDIECLFNTWEKKRGDGARAECGARLGLQPGFAPGLVTHLKSCAVALVKPSSSASELTAQPDHTADAHAGNKDRARIDKSMLPIGEIKRIRSKQHLRFVARQPCVICGRTPVTRAPYPLCPTKGLGPQGQR